MSLFSPSPLLLRGLLAALLLGAAGSALAQWKWRDGSGKIQYSDIPPPAGVPEKDILQRPPGARVPIVVRSLDAASAPTAPASAAPAGPSKAELEQQAKQKQEQEQQARKQKDEDKRLAEQRADNCKRAASSLRALEDGVRISRRNEAGETVFLDEKQRAEEMQRTRAIMASECKAN